MCRASTRVKRIRDLRAELDRVQNLAERAEALAQQAAITGMAPVGVNR